MAKKTPSKKTTKKTVKNVIKDVVGTKADPAAVLAARDRYRKGPKFPKARTAGRYDMTCCPYTRSNPYGSCPQEYNPAGGYR